MVLRAMLVAAYRELNSRKLFWITLAISGLVVLVYGSIGFNENGMSMFFGLSNIESEFVRADSPIAGILYRSLFSTFLVSVWLAWIATILALISTTTMFPDFIAGGAIDLVLSKPIGRVHLFINKYLASLLFVLLQVTIFTVGAFLCIVWRLGEWDWKILLAIPIVTVFFSYLYAVNVLVGVWTRSALTALLVTMIFWFSTFGLNVSEAMLNQVRTDHVVQIEFDNKSIERIETTLGLVPANDDRPGTEQVEQQLRTMREARDRKQEVVDKLDGWHARLRSSQAVFPKTSETIALLDRWLKRDSDVNLMDVFRGDAMITASGELQTTNTSRGREVERRIEADYESKSLWYVIGTSLLFELAVLALACWIFARRDY